MAKNKDIENIIKYLKNEKINIDYEEFKFQFESHPDSPSLLAIRDTLSFFNIANGALKVVSSEIKLLPNTFIANLKNDHNSFLAYIEKKGHLFCYTSDETKKAIEVSSEEFISIWGDIVLLIEKEDDFISNEKNKKNSYFLFIPFLFLLTALLIITFSAIWMLSFYIFSIIGVMFSVGALKDLFNTKSELLNKFCNVAPSSDCESIINSTKWKLFKNISFSDLSITFFMTQIAALFLMTLNGVSKEFFIIQEIFLLLSVPVILTSVYYQKFVEKKWCPICLSIIGVIIIELFYVLFFNNLLLSQISWIGSILYLFIAVSILMIWYPLKQLLKKNNQLKEAELKATRFKRNYDIFKKMLVTSEHYNLPENPLIFGNPNAALKISIITSPFCGHCSEPHYMLKSILDKFGDLLSISIMYSVNPKNERLKPFAKNLIHLKLNNGDKSYYEAMNYWYQTKDDDKWLEKYQRKFDSTKIELILKMQHLWFTENDFNFTPRLFVNGYKYPEAYDIADLPFYINELIEDSTI